MSYIVKVEGNISGLPSASLAIPSEPTAASSPENLITGPFLTFAEFEKQLNEYEKATYSTFRKKATTSVQTARKYLKHTMPDEIKYSRAQFVCTHFGPPRYRGKGILKNTTTVASGCEAEIVLLWNNALQRLVVSKKVLEHNHELNSATYAQQYKVKRLSEQQRSEVKEIIKNDLFLTGEKLRYLINEKFHKCLSLRDVQMLKHQIKKSMLLKEELDTSKHSEEPKRGSSLASEQCSETCGIGDVSVRAVPDPTASVVQTAGTATTITTSTPVPPLLNQLKVGTHIMPQLITGLGTARYNTRGTGGIKQCQPHRSAGTAHCHAHRPGCTETHKAGLSQASVNLSRMQGSVMKKLEGSSDAIKTSACGGDYTVNQRTVEPSMKRCNETGNEYSCDGHNSANEKKSGVLGIHNYVPGGAHNSACSYTGRQRKLDVGGASHPVSTGDSNLHGAGFSAKVRKLEQGSIKVGSGTGDDGTPSDGSDATKEERKLDGNDADDTFSTQTYNGGYTVVVSGVSASANVSDDSRYTTKEMNIATEEAGGVIDTETFSGGYTVVVGNSAAVFNEGSSCVNRKRKTKNSNLETATDSDTINAATCNGSYTVVVESAAADTNSDCAEVDKSIEQSKNFHFFMDMCRQLDSLQPKLAVAARRELGEVMYKYMMADLDS